MPKAHRRTCDQCGQPYVGRGLQFCSRSCRTVARNLADNPAKAATARARIAAARQGKPTTAGRVLPAEQRARIAKALRGKALTDDHRAAIGNGLREAGVKPPRNDHLIGPAHPNWKGGTRPARSADYSNPLYKAFRTAVMERDNWTCQDCGTKADGNLHAHHLQSWAENPTLRYEPSNGVALCSPCHHARHRGVPRPKGEGPRTVAELRLGRSAGA